MRFTYCRLDRDLVRRRWWCAFRFLSYFRRERRWREFVRRTESPDREEDDDDDGVDDVDDDDVIDDDVDRDRLFLHLSLELLVSLITDECRRDLWWYDEWECSSSVQRSDEWRRLWRVIILLVVCFLNNNIYLEEEFIEQKKKWK